MYQVNFHDGRIFDEIETLDEAISIADDNVRHTELDIDIEQYDEDGEGYPNSVLQRMWIDHVYTWNDSINEDPYDTLNAILFEDGFYTEWE